MSATTTEPRVAEIVHTIGQLPAMPHVATRVFELLDSETTTADQLQQTIETDPALATSVLRLVNSAMFSLPERIGTLSHAVMLIGFHRLRSLTVAAVVAGLKGQVPPHAGYARDRIWAHSVNVALAARMIAETKTDASGEQAFVAGLLHDCGRLVLLARITDQYVPLFTGDRLPGSREENEALGLEHQETGAALMEQWRFPSSLEDICARHHGDQFPDGEDGRLLAIVALADRLVGSGDEADPVPAARRLGLPAIQLADLAEALRARITSMRQVLLEL